MTSEELTKVINDNSTLTVKEVRQLISDLYEDVCKNKDTLNGQLDKKTAAKKIWLTGEANGLKIAMDLFQRTSFKPPVKHSPDIIWKDMGGTEYTIQSISDSYLRNIIRFLMRGGGYKDFASVDNGKRLYDEAISRNINCGFTWDELKEKLEERNGK